MSKLLKLNTGQLVLLGILSLVLICIGLFGSYETGRKINTQAQQGGGYELPWPGILPDNRLYKLKVLRDKVIYRMILSPVKKVEFDLLMADKTIYASKLLVEKGELALARDTALKGENYYSMLVQDYNRALLENKKISPALDQRITLAHFAHVRIFKELESKVSDGDKDVFQITAKFSEINYQFIVGLRNPKNDQ